MNKTILVVDDSATMRATLRVTLCDAGYEVIEARDGIEALLQLEKEPIQLLITDLDMPRLDGVGLIANVRRGMGNRLLPIIMLTSENDASRKGSARRAGASLWLEKPFRPGQLLRLVQMVLTNTLEAQANAPQLAWANAPRNANEGGQTP